MTSLYDKIYGCLAGSRIGSAMGAAVEGWSVERIVERYGVLETFQPYSHYGGIWDRPPGCTEDGIERQKLMCTAIIAKQGRITARDLVRTWVEVLDPDKMRYMTEPFDRHLLAIAKAGLVPAGRLGELSSYPHLNTTARSFHAIPLINACDAEGMIEDLYDVGRVYQPLHSDSFPWGVIYNAAVVEATRPGATVGSVLDAALNHASPERPYAVRRSPRALIEQALEIASRCGDPLAMRVELNAVYNLELGAYAYSRIDENVAKALAILAGTRGNVRDAVIVSVNFGRDTDCLAASAGGLAGAFSGTATIPAEWIAIVDEATAQNPYTNARRTIEEDAQGLYGALRNKVSKMKDYVARMEEA